MAVVQTYGGCRKAEEVTLQWLSKVREDKTHWYAILSRGSLHASQKLFSADDYAPTTIEMYHWYIREFGYENIPPHIKKIERDLNLFYQTED